MGNGWALAKKTISEFIEDDCQTMAAALAYYTVFSLPGLLLIVLKVAGVAFGDEAVAGSIRSQIGSMIGRQAAAQIETILKSAATNQAGGMAAFLGILLLVFGATTAFAQLQASLNRAWEVMPDPNAGGWKAFVTKRLMSFGLVLGIAFLLMVSLVISAAVEAFGNAIARVLPQLSGGLLLGLNAVVSLAVLIVLFAAIYHVMPDATVEWRDVWVGAITTGVLFMIGKSALSLYLGNTNVGGPFGAAGSLAVILVWIYYSSMIVLLGAEFTQVWANVHGRQVQPEPGAVRFVQRPQIQPA
jgi:membrane protein